MIDASLVLEPPSQSRRPRIAGLAHFLRMRITLLLALSVLCLSTIDGVATLQLMAAGLEEANPAMRLLIDSGPEPFLAGKFTLTGIGVIVLAAARKRTLFGTRLRSPHVLLGLAVLYVILLVYQMALWFMIVP